MSSRNPTAKGDWGKGKKPKDKERREKEPQMNADERGGGSGGVDKTTKNTKDTKEELGICNCRWVSWGL